MTKRKIWVDWMKGLGMLCIIWGHCFPDGMSAFIYAFNVPVFFIISGFLTRRESSMGICFDKVLHNLIIPYFILAFIKAAGYMLGHLTDGQALWSAVAIIGGFHSLFDAAGCSNLWFVYTLIVIRFVYQLMSGRRLLLILLSLAGALVYNHLGLDWSWAVTNVLLALPFFMLGNWLAGQTAFLSQTKALAGRPLWLWTAVVVCIAVTFAVSWPNGSARMYMNQYGNSFMLFAVGALTGSMAVYLISLALDGCDHAWLRTFSAGSLVTLVFHRELLHPLLKWIRQQDFDIVTHNVAIFLSACLVALAFVPIIMIVKRIFPVVLGRRAKSI